jgi:hypothetical protein
VLAAVSIRARICGHKRVDALMRGIEMGTDDAGKNRAHINTAGYKVGRSKQRPCTV